MIRLLHVYFSVRVLGLAASELILIALAFTLALLIRLGVESAFLLSSEGGLYRIGVVTLVCMFSLYMNDMYASQILRNQREVTTRLPQVFGGVCLMLAIVYYFYPPFGLGRGIFVLGIVIAAVSVSACRLGFFWLDQLHKFQEKVLILGTGSFAENLVTEIESRPELGMTVIGFINDRESPWSHARLNGRILGTLGDLTKVAAEHEIDRIVVAMSERRGKLPARELLKLKTQGLTVQEGVGIYEQITGKIALENLNPSWLVFSSSYRVSPFLLVYGRLSSLVLAMVGLLLFGPLMVVIAVLLKLSSRGSVLYWQERIGQNGKIFRLLKFRSMYENAEQQTGPVWASESDTRITRLGRLLRKWRLDELPQLFNVLRGDMNVVGPRPERPCFVERLLREVPYYDERHVIKPGITGWAQVMYQYAGSITETMDKLQYDLFYIKNMSLGLDLLILLHTCKIVFWGRGAR